MFIKEHLITNYIYNRQQKNRLSKKKNIIHLLSNENTFFYGQGFGVNALCVFCLSFTPNSTIFPMTIILVTFSSPLQATVFSYLAHLFLLVAFLSQT